MKLAEYREMEPVILAYAGHHGDSHLREIFSEALNRMHHGQRALLAAGVAARLTGRSRMERAAIACETSTTGARQGRAILTRGADALIEAVLSQKGEAA